MAFASIEGIGEELADYRAGQIVSTMHNAWLPRKDGGAWEPRDFFRSLRPEGVDEDEQPILLDDADAQSKLILSAFGVTDNV